MPGVICAIVVLKLGGCRLKLERNCFWGEQLQGEGKQLGEERGPRKRCGLSAPNSAPETSLEVASLCLWLGLGHLVMALAGLWVI